MSDAAQSGVLLKPGCAFADQKASKTLRMSASAQSGVALAGSNPMCRVRHCTEARYLTKRKQVVTYAPTCDFSGAPRGTRRVACGNARRLRALRALRPEASAGRFRPCGFESPGTGPNGKGPHRWGPSATRGAPRGTRTPNRRIRSPLLYPLGYWRICIMQ